MTNKEFEYYVIVTETGRFVDIDHSSGGYPILVDEPRQAFTWHERRLALKYLKDFRYPNAYLEPAYVVRLTMRLD